MSQEQTRAVGLVQDIVLALVDEPDQVRIDCVKEAEAVIIEIHAATDDIGKIIGRQGRIIKSIRSLVRAISAIEGGIRVEVEVVD